jgi:hypothetical protein
MPTTRARITLTETDEIARAIDDAALTWPELRSDRSALLRRLIQVGHAHVQVDGGVRALVTNAAGAATGAYPRGARAELLADWPE